MEYVTVVLSTITMVMLGLGLLPFRFPTRLMPLAVTAAAYGSIELYATLPRVCEAAGVAALVAFLSRYVVSQPPAPWSADDLIGHLLERAYKLKEVLPKPSPVTTRMITPDSLPGRRVPRL